MDDLHGETVDMAKGHIYRRRLKSGKWSSWYAVIDAPKTRDGRRRQITRAFPTRRSAELWLAEQVQQHAEGTKHPPLLGEYLLEWVQVQDHLSESTRISYQGHIELYLIPHLGSVPLEDLSTDMIEAVYRHLLTVGLAATTVRRINATLSSALSAAVREGVVATNPAQRVRSRKSNAFHARVWSVDQAAAFLRHAEGDDLYLLWRLALVTGLRRGELLGLRACDIEPSTSSVTIRQNRVVVSGRIVTKRPKTQRSRRIVVVDSVTAELLATEKKAANDEDLIFITGEGGGLDPGWVSRRFKQLVVTYGLPVIRFHDLRHTSATLGLSRGESVKEISARLGHSSTAFTEDLYLQVPTSVARRAAQGLADLLDHQATGGAA